MSSYYIIGEHSSYYYYHEGSLEEAEKRAKELIEEHLTDGYEREVVRIFREKDACSIITGELKDIQYTIKRKDK